MISTLMLIGAHHDDNELMAGTITRHRRTGWRVVSVVMTDGRWTYASISNDNIELREAESRAAAKLLDIESVFLRFPEGGFRATEEVCRVVVETIRRNRPAIIVTHPSSDYHSDHMETCRCVSDAIYRAGNNTYEAAGEAWSGMRFYYCDAWFVPFEPDVYVDASEHIDLKREALACHKSQLDSSGPKRGDMIDAEMTRARYRGFECGCEYAEAFRLVPRPGAMRKETLLT